MEIKKVISRKNLPTRAPIQMTIVYLLAMDYWDAPQWIWGAVILFLVFIWIIFIKLAFDQDSVDIFDQDDKGYYTKKKSSFRKRLDEVMKEKK